MHASDTRDDTRQLSGRLGVQLALPAHYAEPELALFTENRTANREFQAVVPRAVVLKHTFMYTVVDAVDAGVGTAGRA